MLKLKIMLVLVVAVVYYGVTYCVLSRGMCQYYADFYLFGDRSFSIMEERKFDIEPIKKVTNFYHKYTFNAQTDNLKTIGFVSFDTNGSWTDGNMAKLSFRLASIYSDIIIDFDVDPYINTRNQEVTAEVYLYDVLLDKWNFVYGKKKPKTKIKIKRKQIPADGEINLIFKISGMNSPKSLGYGKEPHKLGLSFNSIEIRPKN